MNKLYDMLSDDVTLKDLRRFDEGGDLRHLVEPILNGGDIYFDGECTGVHMLLFCEDARSYTTKLTKPTKPFQVGNVTLDEQPMTEAPEFGVEYHYPDFEFRTVVSSDYQGDDLCETMLSSGFMFATKSGAQAVLDLIGWGEV